MLQKCQVPRDREIVLTFIVELDVRSKLFQQHGKNERARIVVGGVSLGRLGMVKIACCSIPGVVGQAIHVIEF